MSTCYACNNPSTSNEHVPPRLLFPEAKDAENGRDLRVKLITVPSCDLHNSEKSKDDEYLLWILATNDFANRVGHRQAMTKLGRSFVRRPILGKNILGTAKPVTVVDSHSGTQHDADQCDLDGPRLGRSLDLIARGLYFHHFGRKWLGEIKVHADFTESTVDPDPAARVDLSRLAEQLFAAEQQHGENPDVFWHKVHRPAEVWDCVMRLVFYGGCKVTAIFGKQG